ncbi:MAG: hypothetical protein GX321_02800 [Clostridiales bacterium]|nr:hypothetical protein [Clostridiales bacterium]
MDGENLLTSGVDKLYEIKEDLLELNSFQGQYEELVVDENKAEKSIQGLEKTVADEIQSTIKKRRSEIEGAYDKQLSKTDSRIKKIKDKRDKRKSKKVSERINEETASLREENHKLRLEIKTLFKQNRVPSYCNTTLYYALYYPRYFSDIMIIIIALLLSLLVIPCGIYFFILPVEKILYLILLYIISVVFFGGIYLLIGNRTRERYRTAILEVRDLRHKIRSNKKKIRAINKRVKKDQDESTYGLEDFDEELDRLNQEAADIAEQKKEALLTFENTTTQVIASEIKKLYEEQLEELKLDYNNVSKEVTQTEENIKALTLKVASNYEPFIGKDLVTIDSIDALINIMEAGNAATISDAIQYQKQNME